MRNYSPGALYNFYSPSTSFVGRKKELRDVLRLVRETRLVTLFGAGGCGKTRLAMEAATEIAIEFERGVWFIDLAVLVSGEYVCEAIVRTVCPGASEIEWSGVVASIGEGHALIVLDNCEHVAEASADAVRQLFQSIPNLRILATSRHPLKVPGEAIFKVPSLTLPPDNQRLDSTAADNFEAPCLLLERAKSVWRESDSAPVDLDAVASICHSLDGIPLALELAAAQASKMSITEINASLSDMLRVLEERHSKRLPRQQTLRALIDWSYRLLNSEEKKMFRMASIFAGSWSADDMKKICAHEVRTLPVDGSSIERLVASLAEKSVVTVDADPGCELFSMLSPIRHYALERLRESGEEEQVRHAHCEWCVGMVLGESKVLGSNTFSSLDRSVARKKEDFRAAMKWGLSNASMTDAALVLAGELGVLWYQLGLGVEIRQLLHRALQLVISPKNPRARLVALQAVVVISGFEGDYATAKLYCDELEQAARELGDDAFLASALNEQGKLAQYHKADNETAKLCFEQALRLYESMPGRQRNTNAVGLSLGLLASSTGDYQGAVEHLSRTTENARLSGDEETYAYGLACLAGTFADTCEYTDASAVYETALELAGRCGLRTLELNLRVLSSRMALDMYDAEKGRSGYEEALLISIETKDRHREQLSRVGLSRAWSELGNVEYAQAELRACWIPHAIGQDDQLTVDILFSAAALAFAQRRPEVAARLLGAAKAVRGEIAWVIPPAEVKRWNGLEGRIAGEIGESATQLEMSAGRVLSFEAMAETLF